MKRCLHCGCPAELSICAVVSTVGIPRRQQKATVALHFCSSCLQRFFTDGGTGILPTLREALQAACCALTQRFMDQTGPTSQQP